MRGRQVTGIAVIAAFAVFAAIFGTAATLGGVESDGLGAGQTSVLACDNDGVSTSYTVVGLVVTEINVGGIAADCKTGMLSIAVVGIGGITLTTVGPVQIPDDGTGNEATMALGLTSLVTATDVTGVKILIVGSR